MNADIEDRLKKIILAHAEAEESVYQSTARFVEDLGADSLDTVEMVMEIEKEFGIEIEDEEAEKVLTVGEAVEIVKDRLAAKADRERQAQ